MAELVFIDACEVINALTLIEDKALIKLINASLRTGVDGHPYSRLHAASHCVKEQF